MVDLYDIEYITIYIQEELDSNIVNGKLSKNIYISGEYPICLNNIIEVDGSLSISNSTIKNFGNIKRIKGDLSISSNSINLISLKPIEEIHGNVILRYSKIEDLGVLHTVKGKLSLRDTPTANLGQLKHIGSDLFLPKRFQNDECISKIQVLGKIKFWNDSKDTSFIKVDNLTSIRYSEFNEIIPYWGRSYIYSNHEIKYTTDAHKDFYKSFKSLFYDNQIIDLNGNYNYAFILFYDLIEKYSNDEDFQEIEKQFAKLGAYYPITKPYIKDFIFEQHEKRNEFEKAWEIISKNKNISITTLRKYQILLNQNLLTADLIISFCGISHLTNWGVTNIEAIKPHIMTEFVKFEKKLGVNFFDLFFVNDKPYQTNGNEIINTDYDYYKTFFTSDSEFSFYKEIELSQLNTIKFPEYYESILVEKAIFCQFRIILKKTEDIVRELLGLPKVGEGWISETDLYYKVKEEFKEYNIIHSAKPRWLGRQHLDIYIQELNIGIEYQGQQHFEPIEYFGGDTAFIKNIERDLRKKQLCEENDCILIYVLANYDTISLFDLIKEHETKRKSKT